MRSLSRLRLALSALSPAKFPRRGYGSAAVAYDLDDYDEYEEQSRPMEAAEGCFSGRGVQWVILGDPMAKRHVYAERLSKLLQVPHISMGTLVRQELHPNSFLYKQVLTFIKDSIFF